MEENKYYQPEMNEFYIGYEFELMCYEGIWEKGKFPELLDKNRELDEFKNDSLMKLAHAITRTQYLTKEDIESLGWAHTGGQLVSWGRQDFETKWHLLRFYPARVDNIGLSTIEIMTKEDPMVMGAYKGYDKMLYDGPCKSINEFRKLCKWLNINES